MSARDISTRASVGAHRALRWTSAAPDSEAGEAALAMAEADGVPMTLGGAPGEAAAVYIGAGEAAGESALYLGQSACGEAVFKWGKASGEAGEAGEAVRR